MHRRVPAPLVAACLAALATGAAVLALAPLPATAATDTQIDQAVTGAADWLAARQLPDGSFGVNSGLDPAWALIALAGAGRHAADLKVGGAGGAPSAQDGQLEIWGGPDQSAWWAFGSPQATDWERAILQARAAGLQPTRLTAERNLLAGLAAYYLDGWFTSKASVFNHTLFGLLALSALPVPQPLLDRTAAVVELNQHDDGGYTSYPATDPATQATASDIDSTGVAVAALCATGRTTADPAIADAIAFLRGRRAPNGSIGNTSSTSWAVDGMGECGIRRGSPDWTAGDETTVDALLAGQIGSGPDAGAWGTSGHADAYATADALRALTAAAFVVDPPARTNPLDPLVRPAPAVATGTVVPVALVIDRGHDDPRLCATQAPLGATVTDVLAAARVSSQPTGCVSAVGLDDDVVTSIDGAAGTPAGGWRASLDGGAESAAGPQPVPFGAILGLRLEDPAPVAFAVARLDFGAQPEGLLSTPRTTQLTNAGDTPVTVGALHVSGPNAADFVVSSQECSGETLAPAESCAVSVRFGPAAQGARSALLSASVDGIDPEPGVALVGAGVALGSGSPGGAGATGATGGAGAAGVAGEAGPAGVGGAQGATGPRGAAGARGAAGRDRVVSCRLTRARRLACRVADATGARRSQATAPASLSRGGRTYAQGQLGRMRTTRPLTRGRYVLTLGRRGARAQVAVRVRIIAGRPAVAAIGAGR